MPLLKLFPHHPHMALFLLFLIFATIAAVIVASVLIKARDLWIRYREDRVSTYNSTMTDLLLLALDDQAPQGRPVIRSGDDSLFRDLLLSQIKSLSGNEKEYFLVLYRRMSYLRQDLDECHSPFWVDRLKALSRLNVVYGLDFGKTVGELLHDSNELVALTALKILSRDSETFSDETILNILRVSGEKRRHLVAEILANVVRTRGNAILNKALEADLPLSVIEVVVSLISHFRASDAVPALMQLLGGPQDQLGTGHELLDTEIIFTLQKIGDPQAVTRIKPFLTHPSAALRARALLALDALQTLDGDELRALSADDRDPTFQRAIKALLANVSIREAA